MSGPAIPPGAVDAALRSLHDTGCKCGGEYHDPPASDLERLNAALEAAAPHIEAAAWRDGYGQGRDDEAQNLPLREAPDGP